MSESQGSAEPGLVVDHIGIAVASAAAAIRAYRDRLGLHVVHDETLQSPSVRLVYLDGGNVAIQLVEPSGPGPVAVFLAEHGEGLHHLCLRVNGIEQFAAVAGGLDRVGIYLGGRGRRCAFLSERVAGVLVEFTEHLPMMEMPRIVRGPGESS